MSDHVERFILRAVDRQVGREKLTDAEAASLLFRTHCRFRSSSVFSGAWGPLRRLLHEITDYCPWSRLR